MESNALPIDYYQILDCDRTASLEELKKSYQRLALTLHPDKNKTDDSDNKFRLLQKAWSVLREPSTRKQYDATLSCHENSDLLLYETVRLSEMVFDSDENVYLYDCRCGGVYVFNKSNFVQSSVIIGCDECSFSIQVNR